MRGADFEIWGDFVQGGVEEGEGGGAVAVGLVGVPGVEVAADEDAVGEGVEVDGGGVEGGA